MRVKYGRSRHKKKKRIFRGSPRTGRRFTRRLWRTVQEHVRRARVYAFRDRKVRKRDFRQLWIMRLTAAAEMRGLRYSQLIHGLKLANIDLNRKMLSELAIHNAEVFDEITSVVKAALDKAAKA